MGAAKYCVFTQSGLLAEIHRSDEDVASGPIATRWLCHAIFCFASNLTTADI